ncbi:hypothetical protein [Lacticaseibacillus songhuajiangensis]|jgi:hypothetical protein|uniref:hypothetical protein n=1 Tax=Lacticaseibacillus songhuajiangensis TaxID=1296539 RepID=UPI000F7972BC|nr:hypothetical protein [Lacticaseibacillus songhuajiangensis]
MPAKNDVVAAWAACNDGVAMLHVELREGVVTFNGERFPIDVSNTPIGAVDVLVKLMSGHNESRGN